MSAIGSVIVMVTSSVPSRRGSLSGLRRLWLRPVVRRPRGETPDVSPRRLPDAWQLAPVGHLTQADTAQPVFAVHGARPPATLAASVGPHRELRLASGLDDQRLLRHQLSLKGKP